MPAAARILGGALAALALATGQAWAEPALWKVQGPHATVYLFGTVHVLKPGVTWRSAKVDAAFKASSTLWEEVSDADDPGVIQPLVIKYGIDRAHPLSSRLDPADKARVDAAETSLGLQAAQLEPMRPWMAGLTLSTLPVLKAGYDPKSGVDVALKAEAAAEGKPLRAFETTEQQVRFFADMPAALEVAYLLSTVDDVAKGTGELDDLVDAWAAGDEDRLEALLNDDLKDKYPALYRILLTDRNKAFAARIETLLKGDGVSFVAIGAGHLAGDNSVQADLAKDGFKAERQ